MPQYPAYPSLPVVAEDDIILWWDDSESDNGGQTYSELLAQLESDLNPANAVSLPSANITLDATYQFVAPNSGSPLTITVPLASSFPGQEWKIFNKGSADVTLQRSGGDTLAGDTAITLTQYESVIIISDGIDMYGRF